MSSFPPVAEQLAEIRSGAAEILPEGELAKKLERSRATVFLTKRMALWTNIAPIVAKMRKR